MKVYVLIADDWGVYEVLGVYASHEAAAELVGDNVNGRFAIHETELIGDES